MLIKCYEENNETSELGGYRRVNCLHRVGRICIPRDWHANRGGRLTKLAGGKESGEVLKEGSVVETSTPLKWEKKMEEKEKKTQTWWQVLFWSLTLCYHGIFGPPRLPLESPFKESGFFKLQGTETQLKLTWAVKGSCWTVSKSGCGWPDWWLGSGIRVIEGLA